MQAIAWTLLGLAFAAIIVCEVMTTKRQNRATQAIIDKSDHN